MLRLRIGSPGVCKHGSTLGMVWGSEIEHEVPLNARSRVTPHARGRARMFGKVG